MKDERDTFEPATWSIFASTSDDSVMEVFAFIPPLYYRAPPLATGYGARLAAHGRRMPGVTCAGRRCEPERALLGAQLAQLGAGAPGLFGAGMPAHHVAQLAHAAGLLA